MNSSSFDRILRQVLIVPIIIILIGAGVLLWQMRNGALTVDNIESADQRIALTLTIQNLIGDQETGLRGYQNTGDPRFLEPYRAAEKQLPAAFERRRALLQNDQRRAQFNEIEQAHETWENAFAEPLIASIQAGGNTGNNRDAVDLNLQGKALMDDLRGRLTQLNQLTQQRRDQYTAQWRHELRFAFIALALLAVVIGLVIGLYMRKLLHNVSRAFRESHNVLRERAEQTFKSEQNLRTTLQSIGDGVITCDAAGHVSIMNSVAQDLTGWQEDEARNRPLEEVFHILDETTREPLEDPVAKVKRLDSVVTLANHTILVRRDGAEIFIDDSGAPIRDKHGALIGIVLVFRDVTIAKKSQEALLANEKLAVAGRLAATIAHEIHNPLDSVSNLLFLMDGKCTPEEHAQFLSMARQEITRVTQISRAMLSLYRESKSPVAVDLTEMLHSVLLLMERRFASLGVNVETQLPEGLTIHGFPAELRQVFTNLLTNAAEAAGADGTQEATVRLTAEPHPDHTTPEGEHLGPGILICIEDQGPGIEEDIRTHLFKPFYTTKGERGTGLGLWISRGIITKHGGSLELASSTHPEDHGTTLSVYLVAEPTIHPAGD